MNASVLVCLLVCLCALSAIAQQSSSVRPGVPQLVNFSGLLTDVNGKPMTGVFGVTFCLYRDSDGGAPLWIETQNVQTDKTGHYVVMLGSTTSQGLPADVFESGEARWLGVQPHGQPEQPRIMLLSVPYALKAVDAETLGGYSAAQFLRVSPGDTSTAIPALAGSAPRNGSAAGSSLSQVTTPGGTAGSIPQFVDTGVIANSSLQWNTTTSTFSTANIAATSVNGAFNAAAFPGTGNGDIGDRINQVYGQCPSAGCRIRVPPNPAGGCWSFSTPVALATWAKPATIEGDPAGATCLSFTPTTGNAISLDWGTMHLGAGGLRDITLSGPKSGSGNGIALGPRTGVDQVDLSGLNIQQFGAACVQFNVATNITVEKSQIHGCLNGATWTGPDELDRFVNDDIFQNNNFGFNLPVNSVDLQISGSSCDDNLNGCINNGTSAVFIHGSHFENIDHASSATYITNTGGVVLIDGGNMMDDNTSGTIDAFIHNIGGVLFCPGLSVYSGGQTVTQVILSSAGNGTAGLTNCHIQNSAPALIQADYNVSYTAGQAITWPLNHRYSAINWLNSPISVGSGNFSVSTSGTIPLILNCTSASSCGLWLQKQGKIQWQLLVDSGNNFTLSNASNTPVLQLTQAGKLITNNSSAVGASLVTSASTSDSVPINGISSTSHCVLTATNALAAANITTTYISSKASNEITVTHTTQRGMTYDVVCDGN